MIIMMYSYACYFSRLKLIAHYKVKSQDTVKTNTHAQTERERERERERAHNVCVCVCVCVK